MMLKTKLATTLLCATLLLTTPPAHGADMELYVYVFGPRQDEIITLYHLVTQRDKRGEPTRYRAAYTRLSDDGSESTHREWHWSRSGDTITIYDERMNIMQQSPVTDIREEIVPREFRHPQPWVAPSEA